MNARASGSTILVRRAEERDVATMLAFANWAAENTNANSRPHDERSESGGRTTGVTEAEGRGSE